MAAIEAMLSPELAAAAVLELELSAPAAVELPPVELLRSLRLPVELAAVELCLAPADEDEDEEEEALAGLWVELRPGAVELELIAPAVDDEEARVELAGPAADAEEEEEAGVELCGAPVLLLLLLTMEEEDETLGVCCPPVDEEEGGLGVQAVEPAAEEVPGPQALQAMKVCCS